MEAETYVDINAFIYWLGGHPSFGRRAYEWVKRIEEAPRGKYATSSLTVYEALVIIAGLAKRSLGDARFVGGVVNSIANLRGLSIEPLRAEYLSRALGLMEEYGLDYEDSIHLATALGAGAREIISNDGDFDKTPLKRKF
ncbi:MAG: type II toxin-antitoxin system VapC family toxin [Candidatus Bathyarchaeia archaeon]